ncbi:hypothetical protein C8R46DRAFT_461546 [Mycena filopes]|nr:hypothetical protein C8R46DRAFT_461546 [Mycena filopes]
MAPLTTDLALLGKDRADEFVAKVDELASRVSLALDPEFRFDSNIDTATLESLENEVNRLKARTAGEDMHNVLKRHEKLEVVNNAFFVMTEQLQARHGELDPDYEPDFPFAIAPSTPRRVAGQAAQAGSSHDGTEQRLGNGARPGTSAEGRAPASGPIRQTSSTRSDRGLANETPSAKRERLRPPTDPVTFDVVFFPFKSERSMELPDLKLAPAERSLKDMGLVFQVKLPRQGDLVQEHFDDQVKAFCEDQHITLRPGLQKDAPLWSLMIIRKRGPKCTLQSELLSPAEFTLATLTGKKFSTVRNYLGKLPVLLIAPIHGELNGAVTLDANRHMKHFCHVSRLDAAIKESKGECLRECAEPSNSGAVSSSLVSGRTLA